MTGLVALVRLQFISTPALTGVARAAFVVSFPGRLLAASSLVCIVARIHPSKFRVGTSTTLVTSPASHRSKFDALSLLDLN